MVPANVLRATFASWDRAKAFTMVWHETLMADKANGGTVLFDLRITSVEGHGGPSGDVSLPEWGPRRDEGEVATVHFINRRRSLEPLENLNGWLANRRCRPVDTCALLNEHRTNCRGWVVLRRFNIRAACGVDN